MKKGKSFPVEDNKMNESQIYAHLLGSTLLNDEKTNWLVKKGYLGQYDPTYISQKGELFIAEFENKRLEKVVEYIYLNESITLDKLRDLASMEQEAFDVFLKRLLKHHKLLKKKPGDIYVPKNKRPML